MARSSARNAAGGYRPGETRRRLITALYCDMVGSTELGERLDTELLRKLLDRYFDAMRTAVQRHGGTVEKFIGDAVVAAFGVPEPHEPAVKLDQEIDDPEVRSEVGRPRPAPARNFSFPHMGNRA